MIDGWNVACQSDWSLSQDAPVSVDFVLGVSRVAVSLPFAMHIASFTFTTYLNNFRRTQLSSCCLLAHREPHYLKRCSGSVPEFTKCVNSPFEKNILLVACDIFTSLGKARDPKVILPRLQFWQHVFEHVGFSSRYSILILGCVVSIFSAPIGP